MRQMAKRVVNGRSANQNKVFLHDFDYSNGAAICMSESTQSIKFHLIFFNARLLCELTTNSPIHHNLN